MVWQTEGQTKKINEIMNERNQNTEETNEKSCMETTIEEQAALWKSK